MHIYEIQERPDPLIEKLTALWEENVRKTHTFLSEAEILKIRSYVPYALSSVPHLLIAEEIPDQPLAFFGMDGSMLEMLFVQVDQRGKGIGKSLLSYALAHYPLQEVTVNEQNPAAIVFYEHLGFTAYKRSETDQQGGPYPILYMRLNS